MRETTTDLCVIGGGSGGLSVAAGAAQLGARVVLVEGGKMGGDCLNYGCVPSKSLIAAAHRAALGRNARAFGIDFAPPAIDHAAIADHIADVIAGIAPHDSVERFRSLGVEVIEDWAKFADPRTVIAGDFRIRAKRFVLATGSRAAIPPIPGLADIPYLTNETVFAIREPMRHLIVIGAGPIGVELAQAKARLGAKVSLVEMARLMPRDDADAVALLRRSLERDGIDIREGVKIVDLAREKDGDIRLRFDDSEGRRQTILGSHLLLAAGRKPNLESLDLAAGGIAFTPRGITVDRRLRSSNARVYAIGDCAGGPAFTHIAGYHAGIVIRNALFRLPAKTDYRALPWVTYSDPELAQIGLTEAAAREAGHDPRIEKLDLAANDRARAERATEGFIKLVLDRGGRLLGVTIVGAGAGDLLAPWCLALAQGLKLSAMAGTVLPYPTMAEISKRVAGQVFAPRLFSPKIRALVRFLLRLP